MDAEAMVAPTMTRAYDSWLRERGGLLQVVLMGPPGAGKGTQAGTVAELVGMAHVASGDLFREAVKQGTAEGTLAKSYMDRGELVPDDLTVRIVIDRLREPDCQAGFILDGFPRSVAQARALDDALVQLGTHIDRVVNLTVPEETLLARLSGRWLCSQCHASYHVLFNPPGRPGRCDRCGGELYQRIDDTRDTAINRLRVYYRETLPVLAYYRERGKLIEIDGNRPVADVTAALGGVLLQEPETV